LITATIETDAVTLHDYLRVVRRRKWIVVLAALLLSLAALAFSLHQQRLYEASADVLLNSQNAAATSPGTPSMGLSEDPERVTRTQAHVARKPEIVQNMLRRVSGTGLSVSDFLGDSSVSSSPGSDILTFAVTGPDPALTERLANAYAYAYSAYRQQLETDSIERALADVEQRLQHLGRVGASLKRRGVPFGALTRYGALYTSLVDRQQALESMQALQTPAASVVRQADGSVLTQPKTLRNVALGSILGLVLGLILAFLWEALETRARTADEVSARLGGLPLLGRVPEPPRRLRRAGRLVMLEEPASVQAEAFRMLRAKLDFVMLDRDVRTIMVTSALEQEGRSTTVANLAVAFARAGKRVALVDLDLRRPILARFFDLKGPGVTNVALGHVSLEEALAQIVIADPPALRSRAAQPEGGSGNGNRTGELSGLLEVLPSGPIPPDPGEFVSSPALGKTLRALRERCDVVLVDAPQALRVGDAIAVSSRVDGIVVVARSKVLRRQTLAELNRQLATMGAPALGLVATGEDEGDGSAGDLAFYPYRSEASEAVGASSRTEPA
jgi:Mrp family chromosome partitioning ATPase/capsular polysaccharide biosynthesis protein